MFNVPRKLAIGAGVLAAGIGAAGIATGHTSLTTDEGPIRCGIAAERSGAMFVMRGAVETDTAIEGTYHFSVRSAGAGGSSDISQSGPFSAAPGETTYTGKVTLGGAPSYDATLVIDANGTQVECIERIGNVI